MLKRVERAIKRFSIRVLTAVVRTPATRVDEVLATRPRRILVIRQHNQMGDMLLAVPAFRAIKQTYPDADVVVMSAPINRDVLVNNPYVDDVVTLRRMNPLRIARLVGRLRAMNLDWVIVLHTVSFSFTSALLGLVSGARYRLGSSSAPFGTTLSSAFYHVELPLPTSGELAAMNESEHNLYPLRALGIDTTDLSPLIVPAETNEAFADEFTSAQAGKRLIAVHPGAGKLENVWPPERFADVVNRIAAEVPVAVCVVEGPRDAETAKRFVEAVGADTTLLRGRRIGDVAAVLRRCDLVLCNDTGVMHVSAAAGARTLSVFGPTDPHRWAPRRDNLHIVRSLDGRLENVEAATVFERAMELLGERAAHRG